MIDLVSYNGKHNNDNGENNMDGGDYNNSYNNGVEGKTTDPLINSMRERLMKNFFASLLVSLGTPMILGGDEFGRTQNGNNNAYCQDNEISWYNWELLEKNKGLYRFVKEMIAFRKRHPGFMRPEFFTDAAEITRVFPILAGSMKRAKTRTGMRSAIFSLCACTEVRRKFSATAMRMIFSLCLTQALIRRGLRWRNLRKKKNGGAS